MEMMAHLRCSLIFVIALFSFSDGQSMNVTLDYLDRTLNALTDALLFYDREHRDLILDCITWTRMVEGHLTVLLRKITANPQNWNIDYDRLNRIRDIANIAGTVSDKAIPYIARDSPVYYRNLAPLLNFGFWELNYTSRDIPPGVQIFPYRSEIGLDGATSDGCLGRLVGSVGPSSCNVTPHCWEVMTAPGFFGYTLSHQIYWFQIGELNGCHQEMEAARRLKGTPSISDLQTTFCANMLAENRMIANNGFNHYRRDLFMEDIAFCGMYGFRGFFDQGWLDRILSWQDRQHGCYMLFPRQERSPMRRVKRAERELRHGCLAHVTGVAIGALGQYVRYLLEHLAKWNVLP